MFQLFQNYLAQGEHGLKMQKIPNHSQATASSGQSGQGTKFCLAAPIPIVQMVMGCR